MYQLSGIGWSNVWEARPRTVWFYAAWLALYFQLPAIEALLYSKVFDVRPGRLLGILLGKRALNSDVLSYSGEAYFFSKVRHLVKSPDKVVLGAIKDNAICSSTAASISVLILVGVLLLTGVVRLADFAQTNEWIYYASGTAAVVIGLALLIGFRNKVFTLPMRDVARFFFVHLARFALIVYVLQVFQWWVVLPETSLRVWATMLIILSLTNRLPFIPSKDLVGVGIVLGLSGFLESSESAIAAMLITRSVLDKGLNLFFFLVTAFRGKRNHTI